MTPKAVALALTGLLSAAIAIGSLIPLAVPPAVPGGDKLHHLVGYAALTLPCAALHPRALVWVLPAAILQGGLIEIIQPHVNRLGEWADFVANLKGVAIGSGSGLALRAAATLARRMAG